MVPPQGLALWHLGMVCKLKKSLFDLKLAIRQWNKKLTKLLVENWFQQSNSDHSMMIKRNEDESFIALLIYVDNVIPATNNIDLIESTKKYLDTEFKIIDLRKEKYFLG